MLKLLMANNALCDIPFQKHFKKMSSFFLSYSSKTETDWTEISGIDSLWFEWGYIIINKSGHQLNSSPIFCHLPKSSVKWQIYCFCFSTINIIRLFSGIVLRYIFLSFYFAIYLPVIDKVEMRSEVWHNNSIRRNFLTQVNA